jgi:hypothetical protein
MSSFKGTVASHCTLATQLIQHPRHPPYNGGMNTRHSRSHQQNQASNASRPLRSGARISVFDRRHSWIDTRRVHDPERFAIGKEGRGHENFDAQLCCRNSIKSLTRWANRFFTPRGAPRPPTPLSRTYGSNARCSSAIKDLSDASRRGQGKTAYRLSCQYADRTLAASLLYSLSPMRRGI